MFDQDADLLHTAFGIRFEPGALTGDHRPILPEGSLGISQGEAVRRAMEESPATDAATDAEGRLRADVTLTAEYGLFSTDRDGVLSYIGRAKRRWERVPVWLVTFRGEGVEVLTHGPKHEKDRAYTVIIDAVTGEYLQAYSYRSGLQ
jgi:hypothetical protein